MNKRLLFLTAPFTILLFGAHFALAQNSASKQVPQTRLSTASTAPDLFSLDDEDIKSLRKDLQSQRKQIVAANMLLTEVEAEKFWPVYDAYAKDLAKIGDARAALLKQYSATYDRMTDEEAQIYLGKRAAIEQSVTELRIKYIPKFLNVLSGKQTALFYQIDWRLSLLVDMNLAQMPTIEP